MRRDYKYFDLVMALFVTVLLLSNLLSSAKIIDLGFSLGPISFIFDAGTLVFPVSYIFGDILTEVYGYRRSRRVIWVGFFAMALMALFVWLAGVLPGDSLWLSNYGQEGADFNQRAFNAILGGIPGLIVASLAAYFMGEFSNSYVLARMKVASQGRRVWARTIGSTLVGQAVDTVVFIAIAIVLGVFQADQALSLIITNYVFKVGIEVVLTPITLQIISVLKSVEREDFYDTQTDFNPFRIDV
jgi:queuosine precursor transporter